MVGANVTFDVTPLEWLVVASAGGFLLAVGYRSGLIRAREGRALTFWPALRRYVILPLVVFEVAGVLSLSPLVMMAMATWAVGVAVPVAAGSALAPGPSLRRRGLGCVIASLLGASAWLVAVFVVGALILLLGAGAFVNGS